MYAFSARPRASEITRRPTEMFRIYNDCSWISAATIRPLHRTRVPALWRHRRRREEIYRVARLGLRGVELSCSVGHGAMWHPVWEPLCRAVNDVGCPLHFILPSLDPSVLDKAQGRVAGPPLHRGLAFPDDPGHILAAIIGSASSSAILASASPSRERHRLGALCPRPHGLRVGGPLPRPWLKMKPRRLLAPPVQGDLPVRPHRHQSSSTTWAWRR